MRAFDGLEALAKAAERIDAWPPERVHRGAMVSAAGVLEGLGSCMVSDVMRRSGLAEINAKRALEMLVREGHCTKAHGRYVWRGFRWWG